MSICTPYILGLSFAAVEIAKESNIKDNVANMNDGVESTVMVHKVRRCRLTSGCTRVESTLVFQLLEKVHVPFP